MIDPNAPVTPPNRPLPAKNGRGPIAFLVGCGLFIVLAVAGIVIFAIAGKSVSVDDGAILKINLGGSVPEFVRTSGFDELFGQKTITIHQHVMNFLRANHYGIGLRRRIFRPQQKENQSNLEVHESEARLSQLPSDHS